MPRIFSGIQPSGELHIGNYLGAVQNWVRLQDQYECIYCIVDLHALTSASYDAPTLAQRTRDMALGLLAAGVDPERATIFVQSHVPEHSELMWLLNVVTPLGELERMTQYKDKSQQLESIAAGLLNYPILMAADILLYRADLVPVGEDQVQHLELAREICRRWNALFGGDAPFFPEPQPLLTQTRRVLGLDGAGKMSKSRGNTIGLLDAPDAVWQRLRPAVTDPARVTIKDPGNPEICNIYHLHQAFSTSDVVAEVAENCRGARWGCIQCKRVLAEQMEPTLAPIRQRADELRAHEGQVDDVLAAGAARARTIAAETLRGVRERMGFLTAADPVARGI